MMDCCISPEEATQKAHSRKIDKQLAQEKVLYRRQVKILLLGAGESGKSTFLKQMRIIHGKDFDNDALNEFRPVIYSNVLKGMKVLTDARRKLRIEWEHPNNQQNAELILNFQAPPKIDIELFSKYAECVKRLWRDGGVQRAYQRRREFQLVRSVWFVLYFLGIASTRCIRAGSIAYKDAFFQATACMHKRLFVLCEADN